MPDSIAPAIPIQKKVLLIDDEVGAHAMLRIVMKDPPPVTNIILLEAMSFEGGMEIIRDQKPDICLLDLNFTGIGGSGIMRAPETIMAMRESGMVDMLPTIIITGTIEATADWQHGKLWKEARMAGACGFLRKDRYLDARNRTFLLHEFSDAMLEFEARRAMNIRYSPASPHVP